MRNMYERKVEEIDGGRIGFVLSQVPDIISGVGFALKVAWDKERLEDALFMPHKELADINSREVRLIPG